MIGSNWLRPAYSDEMKHECATCGMTETMEHLLSECEAPGQEIIWDLARTLWTKKNETWARPSLGAVISCARATFKDKKGKLKTGDARLSTES